MTAVVDRAEKFGKRVIPLIVPTNNPLNAVLMTAKDIDAQEVMLGASNKFTAEEQLDQIALYWINLNEGHTLGLTVHIVSADRDVSFDLEGGNRIPRAAERQARSAAELRAAGIGVRKVMLAHDGTTSSHDVFEWMLTMLAPDVDLDLVAVTSTGDGSRAANGYDMLEARATARIAVGAEVKDFGGVAADGARHCADGARGELQRDCGAVVGRGAEPAWSERIGLGVLCAATFAMQRIFGVASVGAEGSGFVVC